ISTTSAALNVRSGPSTTFAVIGRLTHNAKVAVLGKNATGDWVQIRAEGISGEAWVIANAVITSVGALPIAVAPLTPIEQTEPVQTIAPPATATVLTAITKPATMNVRGGPGTHHPIVTTLAIGTKLEILALNASGDWLQVRLAGRGDPAWVFANLTTVSGALDGLARLSQEQVPAAPALSIAVVPASAAPVNAAPPAGGGSFGFGITANMWQNDKNGVAGAIKELNFPWVKQQVRWEFVENEAGAVNWSEMDDIINVMSGHNIQVMFSVVTAPQWTRPAKPGTGGPPDDFNVYADFVGKIAGRYCGRLGAIEVWNEQNLQREWEGYPLDAAHYMDLLRRSYNAIKGVCPGVLVISGAPTPTGNSPVAIDDIDYLRGMYNNGLARYSDGVGVHPSGYAIPPEVSVQDWQAGRYTPPPSHFNHRSFYFRSTMEASRQVMVEFGDVNKRLWPTEFGWGQTVSPFAGYEYEAYITEGQQAQYIVNAYRMMQDWGWVGVAFLWNLNYNQGEMAAFSVTGRPAYEALKGMTR
ncbi:MAG: SH3 domain-containing protein, partial [Chloroflexota bacterium]|nr:SH3 domain-containing protein [Chloroflexota bacterium]